MPTTGDARLMNHAGDLESRAALPWLVAAQYLVVAFGQIPMYYILRPADAASNGKWSGTTALDAYFGPELIYYAAAAACAYLLLTRNQLAVHAAWFLVVCRLLQQLAGVWFLAIGTLPGAAFVGGCIGLVWFILLARYIQDLEESGALRGVEA